MEKKCALILTILMAFTLPGVAEEGPQVDFILLVDTSLSMAPAIDDLKQYVAGGIVGRFVQQGDWVAVLSFYGESTIVWEGDIQTEADKAALIRSLHSLEANGRFTDIGTALDDMRQLVIQRNRPDIPKYILLLTDEVQEAPPDSSYRSNDFTVSHEMLEYVRRVNMGSFRAITLGYGLASRIESDLQTLMKTLNDPPDRPERFLPGGDASQAQGTSSPGSTAAKSGTSQTTESMDDAGQPQPGTPGSESTGTSLTGNSQGTTPPTGTQPGDKIGTVSGEGGIASMSIYIILGLVMAITILGSILLIRLRSRKHHGHQRPSDDKDKDKPKKLKDGES